MVKDQNDETEWCRVELDGPDIPVNCDDQDQYVKAEDLYETDESECLNCKTHGPPQET